MMVRRELSFDAIAGYSVEYPSVETPKCQNPLFSPAPQPVTMDKFFPTHDRGDNVDNDESVYLLPPTSGSARLSMARDNFCTVPVFSVDHSKSCLVEVAQAELSALVPAEQQRSIELCCNVDPMSAADHDKDSSKFSFTLEFHNEIRTIKLLPLPTYQNGNPDEFDQEFPCQTIGFLLIAGTRTAGVSARSIVLIRKSSSEPFRLSESVELIRGVGLGNHLIDQPVDNMYAALTKTGPSRKKPMLYIAISSRHDETDEKNGGSSRVDVLGCPMARHESSLFRFRSDRRKVANSSVRHFNVPTDNDIVQGICLSMKPLSGVQYCVLAVATQQELRVLRLPPVGSWNGQTVPIDTVQPLNHALGSVLQVTPIYSEDLISRFAIICMPNRSDTVESQPENARKSPSLSPALLETSPTQESMDLGVPPPQWTEMETRNAVLRARRDLGVNVNTPTAGGCTKPHTASPSEPFDESLMFGSPIARNCVSVATPATEVLDMSGRWMTKSPSDSITSPLAGLDFLGEEVDTSTAATPSIKRTLLPPRSTRRGFQTPRLCRTQSEEIFTPGNRAQLVVVSLEPRSSQESPFSSNMFLFSLPPDLSSFDAFSVTASEGVVPMVNPCGKDNYSELMFSPSPGKRMEGPCREECLGKTIDILLAIKPLSASRIQFVGLCLTENGFMPSPLYQFHADLQDDSAALELENAQISSLAVAKATSQKGCVRLRAIFATKPVGTSAGRENVQSDVAFESFNVLPAVMILPLPTASTSKKTATAISRRSIQRRPIQADIDPVAAKLDDMMNFLMNFEASVNARLSNMEEKIIDNSERISHLESKVCGKVKMNWI